jgi:hypothetical protein
MAKRERSRGDKRVMRLSSWRATRLIEVPEVFGKSHAMKICKTFQVGARRTRTC